MLPHQGAAVHALGFRQADIVAVKDLHHLVPGEARDGRHRKQRKGNGGNDRGEKEAVRIEEIGEIGNAEGKGILQEDQKHVGGDAYAQNGEHGAEPVPELSPVQGSDDPQQQADRRPEQDREAADTEGIGDCGGKHRADGRAVIQGRSLAEVPAQDPAEVAEKLDRDRVIQSHFRAFVGDLFSAHPLRGEGIAGHDPYQQEKQEGDDQQREHRHPYPLQHIFQHLTAFLLLKIRNRAARAPAGRPVGSER